MIYSWNPGHSIHTRVKEHYWHTWLYHLKKEKEKKLSCRKMWHRLGASHSTWTTGHRNSGQKSRHLHRIIREVTEAELHPNNMNREDCFPLRRSFTSWRRNKTILQTSHNLACGFSLAAHFRVLLLSTSTGLLKALYPLPHLWVRFVHPALSSPVHPLVLYNVSISQFDSLLPWRFPQNVCW
jgi:hypothetical protein